MKIQYDKTADVLYIYLRRSRVVKTIKMHNRLNVDLDKIGRISGLEVLGVSRQIPNNKIGRIGASIPVAVA